MDNLLDDLNHATTRFENTVNVPGLPETIATRGSCVAQLPLASRSSVGSSIALSHQGARILTTREIEAWRDPGYYIS